MPFETLNGHSKDLAGRKRKMATARTGAHRFSLLFVGGMSYIGLYIILHMAAC